MRSGITLALRYKCATAAPASGALHGKYDDVVIKDIGYWFPTRQIKSFHPRNPGMIGYRDAVTKTIVDVEQL
jgi:hypothetical protein